MQHDKHSKPALSAGLCLISFMAFAVQRTLPLPEDDHFADTENSLNVPFSDHTDLTRKMNILLAVFSSFSSCVQVAFGTDRSNDGALAVDETDLVVGYDCGAWFIRDERNGHDWTDDATNLLSGDFIERIFSALANPRYDGVHQENGMVFSHEWNLMKITTRGDQTIAPTLKIELKNNPLVIVIR